MFLGLLDPDPLVRGMDPAPDPSIISKSSKKNLYFYCFATSLTLSLKKYDVIFPSGSISQRHRSADPDPHQNVMDQET
jgi:hypothetical protein